MDEALKIYNGVSAGLVKGAVVAIGNFDGVHKGHQALLAEARAVADAAQAPLAVLTFEPHPRSFFKPDAPPFRLTLLPMKARRLAAAGVSHVIALPFDAALASLPAEAFIQNILIEALAARHVVVGHDFVFGKGRDGDAATLQAAADAGAFGLTVVAPVTGAEGAVYSSTRIRENLQAGRLDAAAEDLGWRWQLEAPVIHGDKRGRELGYPTANQDSGAYLRMPYGIYAVDVSIEGGPWRRGVANFGIRPMFRLQTPLLETYIFDFSDDIYGKMMRVKPLAFLRGEAAFTGLEALKEQIKQDCAAARSVVISS